MCLETLTCDITSALPATLLGQFLGGGDGFAGSEEFLALQVAHLFPVGWVCVCVCV